MDNAEVEVMFLIWARFVRGGQGSGTGHDSIISRLMTEGSGASHSTTEVMPAMSPIVELVEQAVLHMPKPIRRVVMHFYVGSEPPAIIKQKLRIDTEELDRRLNVAISFVGNYLVEN
jgi:hypothetical protein